MKHVFFAVSLLALSVTALAGDRCIGSVVNGQCYGTVMPDAGNATLPPAQSSPSRSNTNP